MSVKKLHELEQDRDNIARQMRSLNDTVGDNDWTEEQRSEFKTAKGELRKLDDKIDIEKEMRRLDEDDARDNKDKDDEERNKHDATGGDAKRYLEAFDSFARRGFADLSREDKTILKRAGLNTGTDSAGGFTVPDEFQSRIIETMKDYGGVANNCTVMNTTDGRQMMWSTSDGTTEMGSFIAEGSTAPKEDPNFGEKAINAKKLTSKVILISNELLQDTGVAMDSFLGRRIAMRIGRAEAHYIIQGDGTGLENRGLAMQVTKGVDAATAATTNWKDINGLIHNVDPAYRNMSSFKLGFNDNTLKILEEQEDSQGRPLWLPSIAGGSPATVLGRAFFIDQGIDDIGADKKFMFAGDWNAFILRRVRYMQLKRLTELYAESDQTGFLAFHRFDTLLEDVAAIHALTGIAP